eukprot:TRINITY_DN1138_c0_g1_i1.p1 TRINITY_DN1138_c0_g1~~TRINITY_DN1138_c0_g1_i1.p1  ORF type:complete len:143 (+),score=7.69 TRINITY_DN1138_c0_g1_i1:467-895(+)
MRVETAEDEVRRLRDSGFLRRLGGDCGRDRPSPLLSGTEHQQGVVIVWSPFALSIGVQWSIPLQMIDLCLLQLRCRDFQHVVLLNPFFAIVVVVVVIPSLLDVSLLDVEAQQAMVKGNNAWLAVSCGSCPYGCAYGADPYGK